MRARNLSIARVKDLFSRGDQRPDFGLRVVRYDVITLVAEQNLSILEPYA